MDCSWYNVVNIKCLILSKIFLSVSVAGSKLALLGWNRKQTTISSLSKNTVRKVFPKGISDRYWAYWVICTRQINNNYTFTHRIQPFQKKKKSLDENINRNRKKRISPSSGSTWKQNTTSTHKKGLPSLRLNVRFITSMFQRASIRPYRLCETAPAPPPGQVPLRLVRHLPQHSPLRRGQRHVLARHRRGVGWWAHKLLLHLFRDAAFRVRREFPRAVRVPAPPQEKHELFQKRIVWLPCYVGRK